MNKKPFTLDGLDSVSHATLNPEKTMRHEISLTDDQIEELFDEVGYSVTIDEIEFSRTALDNLFDDRKNWQEQGSLSEDTINGFRCVTVSRCQARKGEKRGDLVAFDLGAVRASVLV